MLPFTQTAVDNLRTPSRYMRGFLYFDPYAVSDPSMDDTDELIAFTVHHEIMDSEKMCSGCCCSSYLEAEWYNSSRFNGVLMPGLEVEAFVGVNAGGTVTSYSLGKFYITEYTKGSGTTKITAYDGLGKLNVPYVPTVTAGVNGYKTEDIINDILTQTGAAPTVSGYTARYVTQLYKGTCREVLGWIGSYHYANGGNWIISRDTGKLVWRDPSTQSAYYTSYPAITNDIIYDNGFGEAEAFTVTSYTTGTTDNVIVAGSGVGVTEMNPWMTQSRANIVLGYINNFTYTPMSLHFRGDPHIEPGDIIKVTVGGTDYKCYVMRIESRFNGGFEQTIQCWGDSEAYYELSTSPMETQINRTNNLLSEMAAKIETGESGVITKIYDANGTWNELTIANNADLQLATSVWRWNINGLAHSTAYQGGTYTFALDDQGRIIASVIQTGVLQDSLGKNSWNLDTGALTITDGSINISTASGTSDVIRLNYLSGVSLTTWMTPAGVYTERTDTDNDVYYVHMMNMYGVFRCGVNSKNTFAVDAYSGNMLLGNVGRSGDFLVKDTNGYTTATLSGSLNSGASTGNGIASEFGVCLGDGTSSVKRTILNNTGLTYYDSSGTQTAIYPADPSTLLSANNLRLVNMASNSTNAYSSSGTTTYTLVNDAVYLVTFARRNSSNTDYNGVWLVSTQTTSNITAIKAPSNSATSASISGTTLSITRGVAYGRVTITRLS